MKSRFAAARFYFDVGHEFIIKIIR